MSVCFHAYNTVYVCVCGGGGGCAVRQKQPVRLFERVKTMERMSTDSYQNTTSFFRSSSSGMAPKTGHRLRTASHCTGVGSDFGRRSTE